MWLREHKLLATAALLVVVSVAAVMWHSREPAVQLTGGGEVAIRRVHYGKTDRWITGPVWKRLIASVVPQRRLPLRMRTQVWTLAHTNEALFLWLEWRQPSITNITNLSGAAPVLGIVDPVSQLESAPVQLQYWIPASSNRALMAFQVTNFPRRAPKLLLRFYDRKGNPAWQPLAEITLRQPAFPMETQSQHGEARSATNGVRVFALTSFSTGLQNRSSPAYTPLTWTALEIAASGPDETPGGWLVQRVQCMDSTGNVIPSQPPRDFGTFGSPPAPPLRPRAFIAGALWPADPWTLVVTLAPTGVPAEDRVMFNRLAVPEAGITNALTNVAQIHGSTIRLIRIAGAPSPAVAATNWLMRTRKAVTVLAEIKPAHYMDELRFVRASDERRTNVYRLGSVPNTPQEFRLLVLKDAQYIDLELGVRRLRQVEFRDVPTIVRTNVRTWNYPDSPVYQ